MNVGIFSGSFNPIHIGHLILANYITEFTEIEEIWFLVTPQNPLKDRSEMIGEDKRLEMVKLAVGSYSKLKASDFEFSLPRPSYTVTTLNKLKKEYPENNFSLIIGADNWSLFKLWKDHETILENYNIYIYPRLDNVIKVPLKYKKNVTILDSPVVEISSTFIRESISNNKNIQAFLPEEVNHYIQEKCLYKNKI